jgi:hypothetical protein
MHRQPALPNPVEKQRLRDAITRHVEQYLHRGGRIRVIDAPRAGTEDRVLGAWQLAREADEPYTNGGWGDPISVDRG